MFTCRQCSRQFSTNAGLYRHLLDVHSLGSGSPPSAPITAPTRRRAAPRPRQRTVPPPSAARVPDTIAEAHEASWHRLSELMQFDGADAADSRRFALRLSGPATEGTAIANLPAECVIRKVAIEVEGDLAFADRLGGWAAIISGNTGATTSPSRAKIMSMKGGVGSQDLTVAYAEYLLAGTPFKANATEPAFVVVRLQRAAGNALTGQETFKVRAVVWYSDAGAPGSSGLPTF